MQYGGLGVLAKHFPLANLNTLERKTNGLR